MKKTLGQKIRELRQERDVSIRDLGDRLKGKDDVNPVSAAFLSDIENGRRFPSDDMLVKLASILGVTVEELRNHDQRPLSREMKDLVKMNAQFSFAFRKAMEVVKEQNMTPDEFVQRITTPKPK